MVAKNKDSSRTLADEIKSSKMFPSVETTTIGAFELNNCRIKPSLIVLESAREGKEDDGELEFIKNDLIMNNIKVLAITEFPEQSEMLLELGADDVLERPFNGKELIDKITNVYAGKINARERS